MNQTAFSKKLAALGFDKTKSGTVKYGIGLRSDFLDLTRDADDAADGRDRQVLHAVV